MTEYETRLFINNEFVTATGNATFSIVNPSTEEHLADVAFAQPEDVERAVRAGEAAFPRWSETPATERARLLYKLADLIERDIDILVELEGKEMGLPYNIAKSLLPATVNSLHHAAAVTVTTLGETSLNNPGVLGLTMKQPFGVVAGIVPWNAPIFILVVKLGPAVGAGNCIILKTSEKSPLSALHVAKLIVEAGFPAISERPFLRPPPCKPNLGSLLPHQGVVNILTGLGNLTGRAIAEHMRIRKIAFTGSTRTGRVIQQLAAASNLKVVTLELGGKSPMIIFEDADLFKAALSSAIGIKVSSGQTCVATSRVYVQDSVKDKFLEAYKNILLQGKIGDIADKEVTQGPQADKIQFDTVMRYIKEGVESGAKILIGGERHGDKGFFVQPTVFVDVPENASINRQEIFGPVSVVHTFKDEAEAISRANDTEYGLYASVFTTNVDRAIRVSKALQAGTVACNGIGFISQDDMPFGGFKQSGVGRENGVKVLDSWMETKTVFFKYE